MVGMLRHSKNIAERLLCVSHVKVVPLAAVAAAVTAKATAPKPIWVSMVNKMCFVGLTLVRYISIGYGNPFHKMINWHLYAWPMILQFQLQ